MKSTVKLAEFLMKCFPAEPEFNIEHPRTETINHLDFINQDESSKEKILYQMAASHFEENEKKPFDHYFPKYNLKKLFSNKRVLDLGCWCGGKTVSYAERWGIKEMYGTDINPLFIKAAILFSSSRKQDTIYNFKIAHAESLPFEDDFFDAIISHDVFEHVQSLKDTIKECKRILKPGGAVYTVFPSYYTIGGGSHLGFVTDMPIMHWLFSPKTLNIAYNNIIEERGEKAYWYHNKNAQKEKWRKYDAGIGINGATFKSLKKIVRDIGFSEFKIINTPVFSVGRFSIKYPIVRKMAVLLKPLVRINFLQDYLSHRIVAKLVK